MRRRIPVAQDLWKRNPSTCVDRVLDDMLEHEDPMPENILAPYWEAQSSRNPGSTLELAEPASIMQELWAPISPREVRRAYPPASIAPGPDSIKELEKVPCRILARFFCIIQWIGRLPAHLELSRTTLIPKCRGAFDPNKFRPIAVTSVLVPSIRSWLPACSGSH